MSNRCAWNTVGIQNMRARFSVIWISEKGPDLSRDRGLRGNFPLLNLNISDSLVHRTHTLYPGLSPSSLLPTPTQHTQWARVVLPQIPVYLADNIPKVIRCCLSWELVQLLCSVLHFVYFWECPRALVLSFFFFNQTHCLFFCLKNISTKQMICDHCKKIT